MQRLAVLRRLPAAVQVQAHLRRPRLAMAKRVEHLIQAAVPLGRDLEVAQRRESRHQLMDLPRLDLAVEVTVPLVTTDDQGARPSSLVLFFRHDLVSRICRLSLPDLLEGVAVVKAEHQDEHVSCGDRGRVRAATRGQLRRADFGGSGPRRGTAVPSPAPIVGGPDPRLQPRNPGQGVPSPRRLFLMPAADARAHRARWRGACGRNGWLPGVSRMSSW